jgi:hypothetical protein
LARRDPEVLARYVGKFVVPFDRKIVAHGMDAATVLEEAARITGRSIEELPLVGMIDPLLLHLQLDGTGADLVGHLSIP